MRERHRSDELALERGLGGGLDLHDLPHQLLDLGTGGPLGVLGAEAPVEEIGRLDDVVVHADDLLGLGVQVETLGNVLLDCGVLDQLLELVVLPHEAALGLAIFQWRQRRRIYAWQQSIRLGLYVGLRAANVVIAITG